MIGGTFGDPTRRLARVIEEQSKRSADVAYRRVVGMDGVGRVLVQDRPGGLVYGVASAKTRKPGSQLPTASRLSRFQETALETPPPGYKGDFTLDFRPRVIGGDPYGEGCTAFNGWVKIENFVHVSGSPAGELQNFDRIFWSSFAGTNPKICTFDLIPFGTGCVPDGSVLVSIDTTDGNFPEDGELGQLSPYFTVLSFQSKDDGKRMSLAYQVNVTLVSPPALFANLHLWHPDPVVYAGMQSVFHGITSIPGSAVQFDI